MPLASESSVPLALQLLTVQIFTSPSTSHLGLRGPDLSDGNYRVSHFSRLVSLSKDRFLLVPSSLVLNQRPPMLAGQSFPTLPLLCACDGGVHCCIACYCSTCDGGAQCGVGLSAALAKSYVHWCYFAEIKRFLYNFVVGRRAADLLHADVDCVSATCHRPHIGCQFSIVMGV